MNQNDTIPAYPDSNDPTTGSDIPEELERVREIILGPDPLRRRLRHAEVDRLREILFGAQIEEYQRHFADLRREVQRIARDVDEIRERFADLEKTMTRRLETLELDTRKLAEDLRRESDRQRSRESLLQQIATQVRQHDDSIKMSGETLGDLRKSYASYEAELRSVQAGIIDGRDQIEQRVQAIRREIRHTEDELRSEMRRIAERLDHQKTDRKALASMLIELAARLETGGTITDMLEGLHAAKG